MHVFVSRTALFKELQSSGGIDEMPRGYVMVDLRAVKDRPSVSLDFAQLVRGLVPEKYYAGYSRTQRAYI